MNTGILRRGGDCGVAGRELIAHARTRHNIMALVLSAALAGLGGVSMATPALAQQSTASAQEYAIPAGSLREALDALGQQSDVAIVFSPDLVDGKRTPGVTGRFTPVQALRKLLEGSGLELDAIDATTYVLKRITEAAPREPLGAASKEREDDEAKDLPTIMVRKPFTDANVDIVRTEDDAQPYYIFDSAEIAGANTVNLEDFLKQRLTMNTVSSTNSQSSALGRLNASQVNLRGLGLDQTLILVNGRRTAGSSADVGGASVQQFDLNAFSPAMIERIEVLPSSASAIYGGSAMGGVLNVILKRDFTGGDVQFTYDTPLDKHEPIRSLQGSYGWSLGDGRTNITVSAAYRDSDTLRWGDRPQLFQRGMSRILERSPELLYSANFPLYAAGTTSNIASVSGDPLVLKDGTALGSSLTYVPAGTSSATSITELRAGLLANAGQQNTIQPYTYNIWGGLLHPFANTGESKSLTGAIRHRATERLELIGEVFYNSNNASGATAPVIVGIVPQDSPTNPFRQDVWAAVPIPDKGFNDTRQESVRMVAGFVMDLPHEWRAQGDYTWNRNEGFFGQLIFDSASGGVAMPAAFASGALNPFIDTLAHPLNMAPYTSSENRSASGAVSTLSDVGLRVSGPIGELPAGQPNLTIGLGHREERQPWGYADFGGFGLTSYFPQSQKVSSMYVEALVPLVAPRNSMPGIRNIDLQLATRIEDFSVSSGTASRTTFPPDHAMDPDEVVVREKVGYRSNNQTIGLRYKPTDSLSLRASFATAFLPPGFQDLLPGVVDPEGHPGVPDPRRGNEMTGVIATLGGGNPDLKPTEAESLNFGFILEPESWRGLRIGLEWFRVERKNLIFRPSLIQILNNEELFPGRVVRSALEPGDPYGVGRITLLDVSAINASSVSTEGIDINLGYRRATDRYGSFSLDLLGTAIDSFTRRVQIDGPEQDIAGWVSDGGPLRLRANATAGWERGPWSLSWTTLYYGAYDQNSYPLYIVAQGRTTVPHQIYHNFLLGYRFAPSEGRELLSDLVVTLGIRNVFDTVPPFDAYSLTEYYSSFGDYRLRSVQLSISKRFP